MNLPKLTAAASSSRDRLSRCQLCATIDRSWADFTGYRMAFTASGIKMKAVLVGSLLCSLSSLVEAQLPPPEVWLQADVATSRLEPGRFPGIPESVKSELRSLGCTIPQVFTGGRPHNVIRGNFQRRNQIDWAVLCSRDRTSSILVFWGGDVRAVSEFGARPDADFLQVVAPGRIGFSRAISVVSPGDLRKHHERRGGPEPLPLTHAGIEDAFVEKASVVWYWHHGKWFQLAGAD